eukprot:514937_1
MTQVIQQEGIPRSLPDSVHLNEQFLIRGESDVAQQYFELYKHRLQYLRPTLEKSIRNKWGANLKICPQVLDCQYSNYNEVAIIGTCFKDQKNKANPLKESEEGINDADSKIAKVSDLMGLHCSGSDFLMLEDEVGSIRITGTCFNKHKLLTGITIAVRGSINSTNGLFQTTDFLLAQCPPVNISPLPKLIDNNDKYIAFISGLEIAHMDVDHSMNIEMLFNYLCGYLGDNKCAISSKICRIIFVGNIICEELPDEDESIFYDKSFKKNEQIKISSIDSRLKELDLWISQLAASVSIDIMPGFNDPSDHLLPQQPFHRCLFPLSSSFNTFKRVTNPYSIQIDNRYCLGSSGQNFRDMMKYSQLNMIECMELSLRARNMAPTAPDTLSCFPFRNNDPFLIKKCPNVYFSGNNDQFRYKIIKHNVDKNIDICLLQLPSFVKTQQIVLFNLNTMKPQVMQFGLV